MKDINTKVEIDKNVYMPIFGLGAYATKPGDEAYNSVRWAVDLGYRLVDTAAFYNNEEDVGRAFKDSGLNREEYFITTKVWVTDLDNPEKALNESLTRLNTEYVDLYLLHWPGSDKDRMVKAWEKMANLKEQGKIKAIGGANLKTHHIKELAKTGIKPSNNQIELHPWHQQTDVVEYCNKNNISITSWGPIFHGYLSEEPVAQEIADKYGKTPAQVTLRWHVQKDINLIPKSVKKERLAENMQIFDFELENQDMEKFDALDGRRSFAFDSDTFDGDIEKARAMRGK